jgi:hypothetical protein
MLVASIGSRERPMPRRHLSSTTSVSPHEPVGGHRQNAGSSSPVGADA